MLDEIYSDVSLGAVPVLRSRYTVVGGRESVAMRRCASPWAVRRVNSGVQKSVHRTVSVTRRLGYSCTKALLVMHMTLLPRYV